MQTAHSKRLVIVGGGYGGVRVALDLARRRVPGLQITLISGRTDFIYYPTLYRTAVGRSMRQAVIPLSEIFRGLKLDLIHDFVTGVDLQAKLVSCQSGTDYEYDYVVIAPGAETGYFNIPGLVENSLGMKTPDQVQQLKRHLRETLTPSADPETLPERKAQAAHLMVVGGGPTGVELSGELVSYARDLARELGSDPGLVTVDLIESAPRVVAAMPPDVSEMVKRRLHHLGVNVFVGRSVIRQDPEELFMKDEQVKTNTVIWTAGVKTSELIGTIAGLELDKRGRVVVDAHLQAKGHKRAFVLGDAASTLYSGLAQTANHDGAYVAQVIERDLRNQPKKEYAPERPIYAIPVGPNWAVVLWGGTRIYGRAAALLRELADLRYFLSILPLGKAWGIFSQRNAEAE